MIALFKHKYNRMAVHMAGISFLLGTLLMLMALISKSQMIVVLCISFLVLYVLVTFVLLLILLVNTLAHVKDIHEHIMTFIIVLMNYPIAILYIHFLNP